MGFFPYVLFLMLFPPKRFQSKSSLLAKIRNLRLENMEMTERIETHNHCNNVLERRIEEASDKLNTIHQDRERLHAAFLLIADKERIVRHLKAEEECLKKKVAAKNLEIIEIKTDAKVVKFLREQKEDVLLKMDDLTEELEDVDIDVQRLKDKYKRDLDRMIIFAFWKLERELRTVKNGKQSPRRNNNKESHDEDAEEKVS